MAGQDLPPAHQERSAQRNTVRCAATSNPVADLTRDTRRFGNSQRVGSRLGKGGGLVRAGEWHGLPICVIFTQFGRPTTTSLLPTQHRHATATPPQHQYQHYCNIHSTNPYTQHLFLLCAQSIYPTVSPALSVASPAAMALSFFRAMEDPVWDMWPAVTAPRTTIDRDLSMMQRMGAVDVKETEKALTFLVDAPGMTSDDIQVQLSNGVLRISGQVGVLAAGHCSFRFASLCCCTLPSHPYTRCPCHKQATNVVLSTPTSFSVFLVCPL